MIAFPLWWTGESLLHHRSPRTQCLAARVSQKCHGHRFKWRHQHAVCVEVDTAYIIRNFQFPVKTALWIMSLIIYTRTIIELGAGRCKGHRENRVNLGVIKVLSFDRRKASGNPTDRFLGALFVASNRKQSQEKLVYGWRRMARFHTQ